jgi:hypothetical protein
MRILLCTLLVGAIVGCSGAGGVSTPGSPGPGGAYPSAIRVGSTSAPGAPAAPSANIDSCTVLSDAEIQAATGHRVLEMTPSHLTRVFPSVCDIDLEAGGTLTIGITSSGGRSMYETSFEPFIGQGSNPPLDRAVEGLGDKAGIADDDDLMVLTGDVLFDILWISAGGTDREPVLRYLAEVILAKLPCLAQGCPGLTLPPPPPTSAPAFNACSLLTEQEIEDATGYKAAAGQSFGGSFGLDASCSWAVESEPGLILLDHIKLIVKETGGREEFDFWAEAYETPPEHLPGLGDDAFKTATFPSGKIYVVEGDRLLTLEFHLPTSSEDPYGGYGLVVPLVELALSRLE